MINKYQLGDTTWTFNHFNEISRNRWFKCDQWGYKTWGYTEQQLIELGAKPQEKRINNNLFYRR